jgi:hypothetical protein
MDGRNSGLCPTSVFRFHGVRLAVTVVLSEFVEPVTIGIYINSVQRLRPCVIQAYSVYVLKTNRLTLRKIIRVYCIITGCTSTLLTRRRVH